jgi:hypothetical protein
MRAASPVVEGGPASGAWLPLLRDAAAAVVLSYLVLSGLLVDRRKVRNRVPMRGGLTI